MKKLLMKMDMILKREKGKVEKRRISSLKKEEKGREKKSGKTIKKAEMRLKSEEGNKAVLSGINGGVSFG